MKLRGNNIRRTFSIAEDAGLPDNFISDLPQFFAKSGERIHKVRNEIKVYTCGPRKINVKKFCIPPINNRILYSLGIRKPKAVRAFNNALEINRRGFNTAKPLAYIIERKGWLICHSYFISEQIENVKQLGHHCKDKPLALKLASYTADLHEKGLMHRDFSPGNILYAPAEDGCYEFSLIDVNRFLFKNKKIGLFTASKGLFRTFLDEDMLKLFVSEYARRRGFNERLCVAVAMSARNTRKVFRAFKSQLKKLPFAKYFVSKSF